MVAAAPVTAPIAARDDCAQGAEKVYVLDDQARVHLFEPDARPEDRFRLVTTARCDDGSGPQTMSLDRQGVAWLLYTSGKLYKVALSGGACEATGYAHPGAAGVLGMSFTAAAPGEGSAHAPERLFVSSVDKGLIQVELPSLNARVLGPMPLGELAGGPDGLLFHYEPESGALSEVDPATRALRAVHQVHGHSGGAFTMLRHRRGFVFFVASDGGASRILRWSPRADDTIDLGVAPDGIRVLGRAQSVCVDWRPLPEPR